MQYLCKNLYFFLKIFGYFKKKLYLCTLNCEFLNKLSLFYYEEKYLYTIAPMYFDDADGAEKGGDSKRSPSL